MRVLWVSASAIGPASRILGKKYNGSSGVWIQNIYEELMECNDVEMSFLCFSKEIGKNEIFHNKTEEGNAFCLNMPRISLGRPAPKCLLKNVEKVITDVQPDIIHIWGTETCVQNVVAEVAKEVPKIVFLQGLIGIHDRYHNTDLKKIGLNLRKGITESVRGKLHDYLFHRQVIFEAEELKKSGNVLVDNLFSIAYCKSLNEDINVYEYQLNPGKVFGEKEWSISNCERHSIFTVYGSSQDKGLHQLLRAISIVKKAIPDIKLYIPGRFHLDEKTHSLKKEKLTFYERLLSDMIRDRNIKENVVFCGQLTQAQMAERLLKANIFVNPSVMEVHAGALREAMLVGTPAISTYCGSVGEYLKEGENGLLYRYEEYEVLAYKIISLLNDKKLCNKISNAGRKEIRNSSKNNRSLYDIYKEIIKG